MVASKSGILCLLSVYVAHVVMYPIKNIFHMLGFSINIISIVIREYDIWIVEDTEIIINRPWYLWCKISKKYLHSSQRIKIARVSTTE